MINIKNLFIHENPIFIPKKHTAKTYAEQKRQAKKRRNILKRKKNGKSKSSCAV